MVDFGRGLHFCIHLIVVLLSSSRPIPSQKINSKSGLVPFYFLCSMSQLEWRSGGSSTGVSYDICHFSLFLEGGGLRRPVADESAAFAASQIKPGKCPGPFHSSQ